MEYTVAQKYQHLTIHEREKLYSLVQKETPKLAIARILGRHKSTIYRELGRNYSSVGYLPDRAKSKYNQRRHKSTLLDKSPDIKKRVIALLKQRYSPKQISMQLEKEKGTKIISHETIYQFIYSSGGVEMSLGSYLPRKRKKRKLRKPNAKKRTPIPNRVSIHDRPKEIEKREEFGHWEGDLMIFSNTKKNLITLRERKSRFMISIKNENKKAQTTAANIIKAFPEKLKNLIKSCTVDNGGEFAAHEKISKKLDIDIYFCDPYSSYQKGTIEQGNGVVRVEHPRSSDMENMPQNQINKTMRNINNRPMVLHGGKSPSEVFREMVGCKLKGIVALQT